MILWTLLWYYEHDYDIMIDAYHIMNMTMNNMNMTMNFMNTSITVINIILMIKSSKNKHLNLSFFIGWGLLALDLAEVFLYIKNTYKCWIKLLKRVLAVSEPKWLWQGTIFPDFPVMIHLHKTVSQKHRNLISDYKYTIIIICWSADDYIDINAIIGDRMK